MIILVDGRIRPHLEVYRRPMQRAGFRRIRKAATVFAILGSLAAISLPKLFDLAKIADMPKASVTSVADKSHTNIRQVHKELALSYGMVHPSITIEFVNKARTIGNDSDFNLDTAMIKVTVREGDVFLQYLYSQVDGSLIWTGIGDNDVRCFLLAGKGKAQIAENAHGGWADGGRYDGEGAKKVWEEIHDRALGLGVKNALIKMPFGQINH